MYPCNLFLVHLQTEERVIGNLGDKPFFKLSKNNNNNKSYDIYISYSRLCKTDTELSYGIQTN